MKVDVRIFNQTVNKTAFLQSYPNLDIPIIFGNEYDLSQISTPFEAVIATANYSVPWVKLLQTKNNNQILGYYIQDFEPQFFPQESEFAKSALATYTMIDPCKSFTKTEWTRATVLKHTGVNPIVAGISVNIDLFRPRDMVPLGEKPVNIVAMIRPTTPYRNPEMTMAILKQVAIKYGQNVHIWLFGTNDIRESLNPKYLDFDWTQLGRLTQNQVASIMSRADIFTDFSSHQAMGLTALEAMACGCSVIAPMLGGSVEFIQNGKNGIIVNSSNFQDCLKSLENLIEDDNLRKQIQLTGIKDVVQYFPEKVSYNILNSLFRL